jgi:ATP synthase protein I
MMSQLSTSFGGMHGRSTLGPVTHARSTWLRLASGEYGVAEPRADASPGQHEVVRGVTHSLVLPADNVRPVMAGQEPPHEPRKDDVPPPADSGAGMVALSYLIGGMVVWGGLGWLADHWLHTKGLALGIGAIIGAAAGVFLIVRRLGA